MAYPPPSARSAQIGFQSLSEKPETLLSSRQPANHFQAPSDRDREKAEVLAQRRLFVHAHAIRAQVVALSFQVVYLPVQPRTLSSLPATV